MLNEIISAVILLTVVVLLVVGAVSTMARTIRYRRHKVRRPVLLGRDRDLLLGLAIPFVVIALIRVFPGLRELAVDPVEGTPHIWYLLLTGLPPIYALGRYAYFELWVIERHGLDATTRGDGETALQAEDREVGDTRRRLQAQAERDETH